MVNAHRDFIAYIGTLAITAPSISLKWLGKTVAVARDIIQDTFTSSKVIEILLQAYNGLSEFGTKTPDLEFAMDLLDQILSEKNHDVRLDMFLYKLDNA